MLSLFNNHNLVHSPESYISIKAEPRWPVSTAQLTDLGVNAEFARSHCTQKPDLNGFKWDFWPVGRGCISQFIVRSTYIYKLQ